MYIGSWVACKSYGGISLPISGKVYGRVLNEKIVNTTDTSVGDKLIQEIEGTCGSDFFALK